MHKKTNRLLCHYCGSIKFFNNQCKQCNKENTLKLIGPGVERLAEEDSPTGSPFLNMRILFSSTGR